MRLLGKPNHAFGAVYANDTAFRDPQGKLVGYFAVATTHIENSFGAAERVSSQHRHRDPILNSRVRAVLEGIVRVRVLVLVSDDLKSPDGKWVTWPLSSELAKTPHTIGANAVKAACAAAEPRPCIGNSVEN
jgi:hypothetical protein